MGNPPELYYKVLNIPKDSPSQEIRAAYKNLVKKWHPDKHPPPSRPEAEARFKAITEAYEALLDQQENRTVFGVYNDGRRGEVGGGATTGGRGEEFGRGGTRSAGSTPGREFKNVYSSTNVGGRRAFADFSSFIMRKPPPVERNLECTLEDLCHGCKKEVKFTRDVVAKNGLIVKKEVTQAIRVKPGWKKGTKITFEGMGDERPGCLPADAVFSISEKKHPIFKRVGNDLVLKVEVPLASALTGWTFSFRLLSGEKMSCLFHDEIIYPGYEKVIKGQGMPIANEKGMRGDLRIKFEVVFPKKLSDEQRAGIAELLKGCI